MTLSNMSSKCSIEKHVKVFVVEWYLRLIYSNMMISVVDPPFSWDCPLKKKNISDLILGLVTQIPKGQAKTTSLPKILVQLPPLVDAIAALAAKTDNVESTLASRQRHLAATSATTDSAKEALASLTESLRAELVRNGGNKIVKLTWVWKGKCHEKSMFFLDRGVALNINNGPQMGLTLFKSFVLPIVVLFIWNWFLKMVRRQVYFSMR